jgi:hypothetical protein
VRTLAFLALLFAAPAWAQVALVTDLSGRAGALAILSEVSSGTKVRVEGELAVLYYASGEEFRVRGPALVSFGATEPRVLEGAPAKRATRAARPQLALKPGGVTPATFVMRGAAPPGLRAQVEAARPAPDAPVSERVAFAAWLEQQQLHDEARAYWKALAAERPGSEKLKSLGR